MKNAVPTIDLSAPGIADAVARTCERTGFLIISGHGFPLELLARAAGALRILRSARGDQEPLASERAVAPARLPRLRHAWPRLSAEDAARPARKRVPRPGRRPPRLLRRHAGGGDELRAERDSRPARGTRRRAGGALPRLRAPGGRADARVRRRAAPSRGFFDGTLDRHFSIMSCHHYPVLQTPPLPGQLRTGATDYGAMTILAARRGGRARGAPARRLVVRRAAAREGVRSEPGRHDGALDQRQVGLDAAQGSESAARRGAEPAPVDRHVRASELRPAHRMRADLPRARREAALRAHQRGRAHQAQDRAQPCGWPLSRRARCTRSRSSSLRRAARRRLCARIDGKELLEHAFMFSNSSMS